MTDIEVSVNNNREMRDTVRAMTQAKVRFRDETTDLQLIKWEHEAFANMVVNYGLTVTTEDGSETLQDPRRKPSKNG